MPPELTLQERLENAEEHIADLQRERTDLRNDVAKLEGRLTLTLHARDEMSERLEHAEIAMRAMAALITFR